MHRYISCMDTHCAQIYIMQIHIVHGYMSWISRNLLPLSSLSLSYIFILLFCFFVNLPNMHDSLNIIFSFTCVQILFKQYHSVLIGDLLFSLDIFLLRCIQMHAAVIQSLSVGYSLQVVGYSLLLMDTQAIFSFSHADCE